MNDYNFNRLRVVGLKEFSVGGGSTIFKITGGKMWGGSDVFSSGVFKLDLGAKTLSVTGDINAESGLFSGNISVSGVFNFLDDDGSTILGNIYSYVVSGGSGKSLGMNSQSASGEVKLTCGGYTRLVAKTYSGRPVIEFYGTQRLYCDTTAQLITDSSLIPLNNNSVNLGTSSKRWKALYVKEGIDVNGDSGVSHTYGYTDDNGLKRYFRFEGGVLVDQHS